MTAFAARLPRSIRLGPGWPLHGAWLGVAAMAILVLFMADARAMAAIWWNSSTFGHCLLIPLILFWLVQQRLPELRQLEPAAWWPGLIWTGAGALLWLAGHAAGVALARHLALVLMLQGSVLSLLGPQVSRGLAFPLFYMLFLVPFGEEFVPLLQTVTARLAMLFLGWAGVPAHLSGVFISTPTGYFEVAEACSGAKFLIAMAAYAVLVCNLCFRGWPRRIVFLAMSLTIAVLANGIRAFGTIYVAHRTSSDFAVGFDHIVYGWVFFAIVLALVMAAGWPLFDRKAEEAVFDPRTLQGRVAWKGPVRTVAPLVIALSAAPLLWAAGMAAASDPLPARIALPDVPGWTRVDYRPAYPWKPHFDNPDHSQFARYRDAQGREVDLSITVYARQDEGRELVGFGQGAVDPDSKWAWSAPAWAPANGHGERIVAPGPVTRMVVRFYGIGSVLSGNAAEVKLQTLKARLTGGDQRAVAILVSAEEREGRPASVSIRAFLRDLGSMRQLADRSVGRD